MFTRPAPGRSARPQGRSSPCCPSRARRSATSGSSGRAHGRDRLRRPTCPRRPVRHRGQLRGPVRTGRGDPGRRLQQPARRALRRPRRLDQLDAGAPRGPASQVPTATRRTRMAMNVVLLDVAERIATITLNRPEARNALSSEVLQSCPSCWPRPTTRRRRRDHPDRRRPGVLRRPRPEGARARAPATSAAAGSGGTPPARAVADAHQAAHRRRQRGLHHRRLRAGPELRLPRRVRAGPLRRHPRPRRRDARVGHDRAAAPGHRRAPGPGDELHRQLPRTPPTPSTGAWSTTSSPTRSCCRSPGGWPPTSSATTRPACARSGPRTATWWAPRSTRAGSWRRVTRAPGSAPASTRPRWSAVASPSWSAVARSGGAGWLARRGVPVAERPPGRPVYAQAAGIVGDPGPPPPRHPSAGRIAADSPQQRPGTQDYANRNTACQPRPDTPHPANSGDSPRPGGAPMV